MGFTIITMTIREIIRNFDKLVAKDKKTLETVMFSMNHVGVKNESMAKGIQFT